MRIDVVCGAHAMSGVAQWVSVRYPINGVRDCYSQRTMTPLPMQRLVEIRLQVLQPFDPNAEPQQRRGKVFLPRHAGTPLDRRFDGAKTGSVRDEAHTGAHDGRHTRVEGDGTPRFKPAENCCERISCGRTVVANPGELSSQQVVRRRERGTLSGEPASCERPAHTSQGSRWRDC